MFGHSEYFEITSVGVEENNNQFVDPLEASDIGEVKTDTQQVKKAFILITYKRR